MIVDMSTNSIVAGELGTGHAMDLDQIEEYLTGGDA